MILCKWAICVGLEERLLHSSAIAVLWVPYRELIAMSTEDPQHPLQSEPSHSVLFLEGQLQQETPLTSEQHTLLAAMNQHMSAPHWRQFMAAHADWYHARQQESEFVYPLPLRHLFSFAGYFSLSEANIGAESSYTKLCRSFDAVTWHAEQPLKSTLMFRHPVPGFSSELLQGMLKLGWTEAHVAAVPQLLLIGDHALRRAQSIAGRLACKPQYVEDLYQLRNSWEELPGTVRPGFPLRRPEVLPSSSSCIPAEVLPIGDFMHQLISFLDKWELIQLTTWHLPEPQGLQCYVPATGGGRPKTAPLGFPVQERDALGRNFLRRHRDRAGKSGIDDLDRHELYRHLWEIEFWEFVLGNRYVLGTRGRQAPSAEQQRTLLGYLLELHPDRIKQYQRMRNRLKAGSIVTLRRLR